jgi:hypothetical protein
MPRIAVMRFALVVHASHRAEAAAQRAAGCDLLHLLQQKNPGRDIRLEPKRPTPGSASMPPTSRPEVHNELSDRDAHGSFVAISVATVTLYLPQLYDPVPAAAAFTAPAIRNSRPFCPILLFLP